MSVPCGAARGAANEGQPKFVLRRVIVSASNRAALTRLATLGRSGSQDLAGGTVEPRIGWNTLGRAVWLGRIDVRGETADFMTAKMRRRAVDGTMAAERTQNLQDTFLNYVRKNKVPLTIFLVNGVKLQGVVTWFDNFCVLLRRDGHSQLVYKHAISTVMPGQPIQMFEAPEDAVPTVAERR